ncbi:MAG: integral rane protein [Planctomycetaceae bacterium]|nr:integral rane protein [Planctomycetaceae bacterium]
MASGRWNRFIDGLVRYRLALLCLAIALTGLSISPANQVTFDQTIESLYAPGNPRLIEYTDSKAVFGGDEFIFLTYTDPQLFEDAGQERLANLAARAQEVPGVVLDSVQSLNTYLELTNRRPFKSRRAKLLEFARGVLLGDDNQTTAIAMRLENEATAKQPRPATIAELRRIAAEQSIPTSVVGEPTLVLDMFRYAEEDGLFMGWAASILMVAVILFFLRDVRSIILPFVIVQMTILWTKAGLWSTHLQLTMVSSILGSLVTIIGVSTVVYLSFYFQELRQKYDRETAFRKMLQIIGVDIAWVCVTTATGFAAHLSSHLHPVRSFGLTMVMGSLLVLVAMALVLPAGMLLGAGQIPTGKPRGEQQVNQSLHRLTAWVLSHQWWIGIATVFVLVGGISGLWQLRVDTDFTRNFRSSSSVVKALSFMEEKLGGAGLWEVNFSAPPELDEDHLEKVRQLTKQLREMKTGNEPALTKVISLTDGLDILPRIPILVPDDEAKIRWLNGMQSDFSSSLFNPEKGRMRIMLRARERQTAEEKELLITRVTELTRSAFPEAKVTGLFVLLNYLVDSLLSDQILGLVVGAIGLIVVMAIAYRSIWMGLISLVPNVLPILLLLGGMGWAGIPVNIGTAMISSDTMGLTIHDSIFYLSAYNRARQSGLDFRGALHEVQTEVRRPLIYSNIALILGFLVLTTSNFVPLIYFGALVSTAIAGGLLVNLLLIPLLLQIGEPRQPTESSVAISPEPGNENSPREG